MAKFVLALDLEPGVIESIELAANTRNETLAQFAERLFNEAVGNSSPVEEAALQTNFPDWIIALTMADSPTPDFDAKAVYADYIMKKYSV